MDSTDPRFDYELRVTRLERVHLDSKDRIGALERREPPPRDPVRPFCFGMVFGAIAIVAVASIAQGLL